MTGGAYKGSLQLTEQVHMAHVCPRAASRTCAVPCAGCVSTAPACLPERGTARPVRHLQQCPPLSAVLPLHNGMDGEGWGGDVDKLSCPAVSAAWQQAGHVAGHSPKGPGAQCRGGDLSLCCICTGQRGTGHAWGACSAGTVARRACCMQPYLCARGPTAPGAAVVC